MIRDHVDEGRPLCDAAAAAAAIDRLVAADGAGAGAAVRPNRPQQPRSSYLGGGGSSFLFRDPALLISDRGICSFGESSTNLRGGLVWIRCEERPRDTQLHQLMVRGYRNVSNTTLRHLSECAPELGWLDVRETGVTAAGVQAFRRHRPHCHLVSSFDAELPPEGAEEEVAAAVEAPYPYLYNGSDDED